MKVSELMTRYPEVAGPEWPLADAIGLMSERSLRHLPVVERGRLVGVVSERDLLEATGWRPDRYFDEEHAPKVVRDYMTVNVETIGADDEAWSAIDLFLERRLGCLPVVDVADRLEGILTVADLLTAQLEACSSARGVGELDAVVAACMSETPLTADVRTPVGAALEVCRANGVRHLPVESTGWFVGLVSDRDLRLRVGRGELERPVGEIMTTHLSTVGPESLLSDAVELMRARRLESTPVTRMGRLVGMLTTTDVLELLHDRMVLGQD